MNAITLEEAAAICRPVIDQPSLHPGAIIAEFSCGRDALIFSRIKNEDGQPTTVTPGINHPYAVRLLELL